MASADFDEDGRGSGNRNLGAIQRSVTLGPGLRSIVAADFDDDGIDDFAVAETTTQTIRLVRSFGDGTFSAPVSLPVGAYPYRVAAGDLNRDGTLDLAVSSPQQVSTFVAVNPFAFGTGKPFRAGPARRRTGPPARRDRDRPAASELA